MGNGRYGTPCDIVKAPAVALIELLVAVQPGTHSPASENRIPFVTILRLPCLEIEECVVDRDQLVQVGRRVGRLGLPAVPLVKHPSA